MKVQQIIKEHAILKQSKFDKEGSKESPYGKTKLGIQRVVLKSLIMLRNVQLLKVALIVCLSTQRHK